MKKTHLLIFSILVLLLAAGAAMSQNEVPEEPTPQDAAGATAPRKPDLLRELGLTPEQIEQVRQMNRDRRPAQEAATRRLREANRMLDQAIYAEVVDDNAVQLRLAEFQAAQADIVKLRFMNELAVRRILTTDQLAKFRELRRRFAEERQQNRRKRALRRNARRSRQMNAPKPLP